MFRRRLERIPVGHGIDYVYAVETENTRAGLQIAGTGLFENENTRRRNNKTGGCFRRINEIRFSGGNVRTIRTS